MHTYRNTNTLDCSDCLSAQQAGLQRRSAPLGGRVEAVGSDACADAPGGCSALSSGPADGRCRLLDADGRRRARDGVGYGWSCVSGRWQLCIFQLIKEKKKTKRWKRDCGGTSLSRYPSSYNRPLFEDSRVTVPYYLIHYLSTMQMYLYL